MPKLMGQVRVRSQAPWSTDELEEARDLLGDGTVIAIGPSERTIAACGFNIPPPPRSYADAAKQHVEQRLGDLKPLVEVTYEDGPFLRPWD